MSDHEYRTTIRDIEQLTPDVRRYRCDKPDGYDFQQAAPLYVWLHGRGDKTTDLYFLHQRATRPGQLKLKDALVLHPFGRHCIGFKSAGEIDVLEAIDSVVDRYKIDRDRIVLAGFSMGGAGAWHIGAHYTDRFAAVHAGAGFAETKLYTRLAADAFPPKYEQALWQVYDVPSYARNLLNVPLIAYSGEIDKQKQAADVMAAALKEQAGELKHVIGPGMGHKYHPESLTEIQDFLADTVQRGRDQYPKQVHLQTPTLRYNRMHWLRALALDEHWREARIDAQWVADSQLVVSTRNVRVLRLVSPAANPGKFAVGTKIEIDGQALQVEEATTDLTLVREQQWRLADTNENLLPIGVKRHGLQGPIDDAFLAPFLVVTPTRKFGSPEKQRWVEFELAHFLARWQAVYRGELRTKRDDQVTDDDLEQYHLVLFGDVESNRWIEKIADRLPIACNGEQIKIGDREFDAQYHLPLMICPNPKNPLRYVVLNSGPTHREAHDRTNSLQNPKLPDWALVDVRVAPTDSSVGKIVAADFFDEQWQVKND